MHMYGITMVKNLMSVHIVIRNSHTPAILKHMKGYIQVKNHIAAASVITRALVGTI